MDFVAFSGSDSLNEVTQLIQKMANGNEQAIEELYELVYQQLRRMASKKMASERANHTLDPTALVNEVYLRLVGDNSSSWQDRRHFFGVAAEAMRRILIERARAKSRLKRGGNLAQQEFTDGIAVDNPISHEWLDLDEALTKLESYWPEQAELVKMHMFSGLTLVECSQALGVSLSTVERKWRFAKGWLKSQLSAEGKER